ncbi:hypothetical protein CVIRNUC_009549 [Coccomyxa viridis]|uniref:Extracellular protein n=1 Tax=Coccomyxa viridis TaxID=1274662 RepID=A0AAV1II67_9CHLO|nr:hypothetical protein CVIRNUC_009549 [Coccomyxa viridis]
MDECKVLLLLSAVLLTAAPSSAHRMLAQAPAFVPELQAAAHQALAPSFQAAVPTLQAVAEQLPASLPVDGKTKSLIQTAVSDLFSAIAYTGGDQQKLSQTQAARPEPVYCGANNHAVHVQATGTTCNVTVFDINNPTSVILNPTKPCDHSIYNKTCTAFQGALLIDISPALDARTGKLLKQQNPDIQGYLTALDMGELVSAGMVSINVLFSSDVQVTNLTFLPALEATTGIPTGLSTDFTKPFISQLKINGGGPMPGFGAQDKVASFSSTTFKPKKVLGNLQITATALPDQAGFDELQGVSGNALIANNNAMSAFNFYSLKYIGAGITLFQNPSLTTFEAPRLLAIASNSGNDIATGLQISQNPKLTKLNLPMLEAIGGPLIIQNNTALASLESLEHLAVVNATGRVPSIKMPGLLPPPGSGQPSVGGFTINPPSVLIFGNPQLYDIAALAKLGQCSTTPSTTMGAVFIEVYPKNTNLKCTFTAWAPVCQYILSQLTVDPSSEWRKNGICIPTST